MFAGQTYRLGRTLGIIMNIHIVRGVVVSGGYFFNRDIVYVVEGVGGVASGNKTGAGNALRRRKDKSDFPSGWADFEFFLHQPTEPLFLLITSISLCPEIMLTLFRKFCRIELESQRTLNGLAALEVSLLVNLTTPPSNPQNSNDSHRVSHLVSRWYWYQSFHC